MCIYLTILSNFLLAAFLHLLLLTVRSEIQYFNILVYFTNS